MWFRHIHGEHGFAYRCRRIPPEPKYLGKNFKFDDYVSTGGGISTADNLLAALKRKRVRLGDIVASLRKAGLKTSE